MATIKEDRWKAIQETLDFGAPLLGQQRAMALDGTDLMAAVDNLEGLRRIYIE